MRRLLALAVAACALSTALPAAAETRAIAATTAATGQPLSWNAFQQANAGRGWDSARMSREYKQYKAEFARSGGEVTTTTEPPAAVPSQNEGSWRGGAVFFALVVAAVVGSVLWRRRKRDARLAEEMRKALSGPELTMAEVYSTLDGLEDHPDFGRLLETATAVSAQLDELKARSPSHEGIARARSLNTEANRVRTAFDDVRMQLARRR